VTALMLVTGAWHGAGPRHAEATGAEAVTAPSSESLALDTVAARTTRSVVTVDKRLGFVGWQHKDFSLVVTVGGEQGDVVAVAQADGTGDGEIIRADAETGLALVRVAGDVGRPVWRERRPASVSSGDWLVAVDRTTGHHVQATSPRYAGIAVRGRLGSLVGAPVLSQSGRLVGIAGATGVIPIGRACGTIRRCG
jgi:hypothetical protein